jgi:DNA-binding NarL/FixJ family response regulator
VKIPTKRVRVLLADDQSLGAAGLRAMLEASYEVVGSANDGRALVRTARRLKPEIILLDISMPELSGLDAARQLRKLLPDAKLIFVTVYTDGMAVREALRAGGSGYLARQSDASELFTAIKQVLRGHTYVTPLVTRAFAEAALRDKPSGGPLATLTSRQLQVLRLVGEGCTTKEAAGRLGVSSKTVDFHKSNIMRALDVRTTAGLIKYAIRNGLVHE